MSKAILYVPGLRGDQSFSKGYKPPAYNNYDYALYSVAVGANATYRRADYQTAEHPYPLLSEMGQSVQQAIDDLADHDHIVAVASSVGAGVLMQAMFNNAAQGKRNPDSLVFICPVLDPTETVIDIAKKSGALEKLEEGDIPHIPVPISYAKGQQNPGNFLFTLRHLQDPNAIRLLAEPISPNLAPGLKSLQGIPMKVFNARRDPFALVSKVRKVMGMLDAPSHAMRVWEGGHNDTNSERIQEVVTHMRKTFPPTMAGIPLLAWG